MNQLWISARPRWQPREETTNTLGGMMPVLVHLELPFAALRLGPALCLLALGLAALVALAFRAGGSRSLRYGLSAAGVAILLAAILSWPVVVELKPIVIYSHGAFLAAAIAVGWLDFRSAPGVAPQLRDARAWVPAAWVVGAGLLGGRLLDGLVRGEPSSLALLTPHAGGSSLPAACGFGILAAFFYTRRSRCTFWGLAEPAASGLALGIAVGSVGAHLSGTSWGLLLPKSSPEWLQRLGAFPRWTEGEAGLLSGSPAWLHQVERFGLAPSAERALPVHPTALYEALGCLGLWAALRYGVAPRPGARAVGTSFRGFLLGYATLRFLIGYVQARPGMGEWGPEWSRLGYCAVAAVLWGALAGIWASGFLFVARLRDVLLRVLLAGGAFFFVLLWMTRTLALEARVAWTVEQGGWLLLGAGAAVIRPFQLSQRKSGGHK